MRALGVALVACGALGCGVSPCKTGTGFLTYRLAAGTESADAIDVALAVGDAAAQTTRVARKTRAASGSIEVDFHAYPKAQPLTVTLTARLGDDILATATQATTAGARCTTLSFDLAAVSGGDVDMSDATDLVDDGEDQAASIVDLAGADLSIVDMAHADMAHGDMAHAACIKPDQACSAPGAVCCSGTACMTGVCAVSDLMLVGRDSTGGKVAHFDGTKWKVDVLSGATPQAVWGNSPTNYWIVGSSNTTSVYRYNGSVWTACTAANCPKVAPLAMAGLASNDVWLASSSSVLHFDGATYTEKNTGLPAGFLIQAVWASSTNNVWITGNDSTSTRAALHWDGATWTPFAAAKGQPLWGTGPNDIWTASYSASSGPAEIQHWDGTKWSTPYPIDGAMTLKGNIYMFHGSSATDVWGVGITTVASVAAPLVVHWDGVKWSTVPLTAPSGSFMSSVWAASPKSAWAVGGTGTSYALYKWNGLSWSEVDLTSLALPSYIWRFVYGSAGGGK